MSIQGETQPNYSINADPVNLRNYLSSSLIEIGNNIFLSVEVAEEDVLHMPCNDTLPKGQVEAVFRSAESGPCGGVKMALLGITAMVGAYANPERSIVVNAPPTNGADSNAMFREQGVKIGTKPKDLNPDDVYIISAHGNPRDLREAEAQDLTVFDMTCPFVKHTHDEIRGVRKKMNKESAEGNLKQSGIIYLSLDGKAEHPERVGAKNLAEDHELPFLVVEKPDDVHKVLEQAKMLGLSRLRIVSQTTNNAEEAVRMARNIVDLAKDTDEDWDVGQTMPFNERDICRTVTDRQNAVREMITTGQIDTLLIVGSVKSKNTKSLVSVALDEAGQVVASAHELSLKRIVMINSWHQIPIDITGKVGVASGASTLDSNVDGVITRLGFTPSEVMLVGEDESNRRNKNVFMPIDRYKAAQKHLASEIKQVQSHEEPII